MKWALIYALLCGCILAIGPCGCVAAAVEAPVPPESDSLWSLIVREPECRALRDECNPSDSNGVGAEGDAETDLQVASCIVQLGGPRRSALPVSCQQAVWSRILVLVAPDRLASAAAIHCPRVAIDKCSRSHDPTVFLSCLVNDGDESGPPACHAFVQKLEWIAFSDFRLVAPFVRHCESDVHLFSCGRLSKDNSAPFSQGETLSCLQNHVDRLESECKREVLHLSELQSEDVKFDRQLYFSCAKDQLRFCPDLAPGSSAIYKCLMLHKSDRSEYSHVLEKQITQCLHFK